MGVFVHENPQKKILKQLAQDIYQWRRQKRNEDTATSEQKTVQQKLTRSCMCFFFHSSNDWMLSTSNLTCSSGFSSAH